MYSCTRCGSRVKTYLLNSKQMPKVQSSREFKGQASPENVLD